jgi:signal transduction histidine kinase
MKAWRFNPINWPLSVKVPLLAALMMVAVATVISQVVLARISESQEKNLNRLAGAYLDGISTAIAPHLPRQDIWETYDALDRARRAYEGLKARYTIVTLPNGRVLAASEPKQFPVDSLIPAALRDRFASGRDLIIHENAKVAWVRRNLASDDVTLGRIYAEIDLGELIRERREVLVALIAANSFSTLLLAAVGYLVVRHMVQPVSVLARHVEQIRSGAVDRIPDREVTRQSSEFSALFRRFNAMADALNERSNLARRLAGEEKLALLGKLASGMAHEVNNPLGGMMNAVDTMRRHGDRPEVRETSLGLLERGLAGIRNVVRATLVTYKDTGEPSMLSRKDLEDLQFLVHHETVRRHLRLEWVNELPHEVSVDGASVRQAALNLLLNACTASPINGTVSFKARIIDRNLAIEIVDAGPGLPESVVDLMLEATPETLPPSGSTGLGTWTAARLVLRMKGHFDIATPPSGGTIIRLYVPIGEQEETFDAVA